MPIEKKHGILSSCAFTISNHGRCTYPVRKEACAFTPARWLCLAKKSFSPTVVDSRPVPHPHRGRCAFSLTEQGSIGEKNNMSHLTHSERLSIENKPEKWGKSQGNRPSAQQKSHTTVSREMLRHRMDSGKGVFGRLTNRCVHCWSTRR